MSTSLYIITNSHQSEERDFSFWNDILKRLGNLDVKDNFYQEQKKWSYGFEKDRDCIVFNGSCIFSPEFYSQVGVISTPLNYSYLYKVLSADSSILSDFRSLLYQVIKIMGGTEVIFLADNANNRLCKYLEDMAEANFPYEKIKGALIKEFGAPITDYKKLDFEKLDYSNITEFVLDDFRDLI